MTFEQVIQYIRLEKRYYNYLNDYMTDSLVYGTSMLKAQDLVNDSTISDTILQWTVLKIALKKEHDDLGSTKNSN